MARAAQRKQRTKTKSEVTNQNDIIASILASDKEGVLNALRADPDAINTLNGSGRLNAAMLAAFGGLSDYIDDMMELAGSRLDFRHRNHRGLDLMEIAFNSLHGPTIDAVQRAYERHAPHIVNNWPEP
jgi:hypothetical protein